MRLLVGAFAVVITIGTAGAQLLPGAPRLPDPGSLIGRAGALSRDLAMLPDSAADRLARLRLDRIAGLVRAHPDRIELDPDGFPARAGEVIVSDPDAAGLAAAAAHGYRLIDRGELLGVGFARLAVPESRSLRQALRELGKLRVGVVSADQLHLPSGTATRIASPTGGNGLTVGVIDGGVASGAAAQRGFASGAPQPSDHGAAVASLIAGAPGVRGAAPGARLLVADVYGTDPAGGGAAAIAKALAWLVGERAPVINLSLVGPPNPLLARVVAAAQTRGTMLVAAVGNDGPAGPLAYPASYPGVIAVTAVDARGRVLIEAGHAAHVDYAAPGADMMAAAARGGVMPVRGTSFAAPLVAGLLARAYTLLYPKARAAALARLDAQARRGARYGRGLLCADCRTAR